MSLPWNPKSWKKDIEFFSKISVSYIVKSPKREADKAFDKAELSAKILDWQTVICQGLILSNLLKLKRKEVLAARKGAFKHLLC